MLTSEQKERIAQAANRYCQQKGINAKKLAPISGVNATYIHYILTSQLTYLSGDTMVEVPDKYFISVAQAIKMPLDKVYWPHVETNEYIELVANLRMAREEHLMKMIFIETGAGKTYGVEDFKKDNPLHTYVITMHHDLTVNGMFNELAMQLGVSMKNDKGYRRTMTIMKLRDIYREGGNPTVIIDEGENMNTRMRATVKGFVDGVLHYCSIVVVGTPRLEEIMKKAKDRDDDAGPQLFRRFRAGMVKIKVQQKKSVRYQPFFDGLADIGFPIEDGLKELLYEISDNYGELHDWLEPALREADKKGVKCTEDFFRMKNNMPKTMLKRA